MRMLTEKERVAVDKFINDISSNVELGKIEEVWFKTGDFYHPVLDSQKPEIKNNAKYILNQIRTDTIGASTTLRESIKSVGVTDHVWVLETIDPADPFEGETIDGNTRIVTARNIELEGESDKTIDIPAYLFKDKELISFVRRHIESIQLRLNDHKPSSSSNRETIKKEIRQAVTQATPAQRNDKRWKEELIKNAHWRCEHNYGRKTVSSWVSEVYNTLEAQSNRVRSYVEPTHRNESIDKVLVGKKGKKPDYKEYRGCTATHGLMDKYFGSEVRRRAYRDPSVKLKPSILVFFTTATSEERVTEAQLSQFLKIQQMELWTGKRVFDKVYALSQTGDERLLTYEDVKDKAENLGLISKPELKIAKG